MTAAADPERVVMMAPIVLGKKIHNVFQNLNLGLSDFLNMDDMMHQMWRNMGNWTFTFTDYWYEGINGR